MLTLSRRRLLAATPALILAVAVKPALAAATPLRVISSGGFAAALKLLGPKFTQDSGIALDLGWGPSMGATPEAVPQRISRGEEIDVVIMVGYALDDLITQQKVLADSKAVLARSGIGIVVKSGSARPDVSTPDALKTALLAAKSIAYSDSASGVYIEKEMLAKLGIADAVRGKARMIPGEPVGQVVARGEAEIGFQQISELKPITGIDFLGPVPEPLQKITQFSAGIVAASKQVENARKLLAYLGADAAKSIIRDTGMDTA